MSTLTTLLIAGAIALWFQSSTQNPGQANAGSTAPPSAATVAPSQAVITVHGVCEEGQEKSAGEAPSCVTVITREQFEKLEHALNPGGNLSTSARNNLARLYAEYLTIEAATRNAGMADTAEFHELMKWTRARAATEYYRRSLEQKYSNPAPEEIDAYYHQHLSEFEKARIARVLIPRDSSAAHDKDVFNKKALEAATAARASLTQGVEPAEVQQRAYAALGLTGPPSVDLGNRYRMDFVAHEAAEVFALKPGEVTRIETETKHYAMYKVLSRDTVPEADAKETISRKISEQKFSAAMKSVLDTAPVDLNEQYFGTQTH